MNIKCETSATCTVLYSQQWRRLHGERGARAPTFTNGWARGIVSRRTANKKLTKLYTDHHESAHRNDCVLLEPKSGGARPKKNFPALCA